MYKKWCQECEEYSYSSAKEGEEWKCPTCGKDLSDVESEPARNGGDY